MTSKILLQSARVLFVVSVFTATLAAQSVELYPNAGGFWPNRIDSWGDNKIRSEGIYGLKGGYFFDQNIELEGSFGYINHLGMTYAPTPGDINPSGANGQRTTRGFLYDVNGVWNFSQHRFRNTRFTPYVAAGVGGLTTEVRSGSAAFLGGGTTTNASGNIVQGAPFSTLHDGDTFFTVNYGGGIKLMNIWGPVGFRADIRGRTIPNFFRQAVSWPEVTGGVLLSFGER
jgi:hypothetical protein